MTIKQISLAITNYQKIMRATRNTDKRTIINLIDEQGNEYSIEQFLYDVVDNGKVIFKIKKKEELQNSEPAKIYPTSILCDKKEIEDDKN